MMSECVFESGDKIRTILYYGKDYELSEADALLQSYKNLLIKSPVITKGPGVDFKVKLTNIIFEPNIIDNSFVIIGEGVII